MLCDSGALCAPDCSVLPSTKVPRPIFPLDQDIDITAWKLRQQSNPDV
ncbi:MAG: hypothetical protein LH632_07885 [Rhodoferax sp.]|nr:hypothetical protein [Rhodoferax sp.]